MPALSLRNVTKEYVSDGQPVRALDGVSLDVERGAFVALVGRSGCGKTTLLNLSGAMDFPSSGEVQIDGIATSRLDDAALTKIRRTKVGFVFQSFQLLHTLTVIENVEPPLLLAGRAAWRSLSRDPPADPAHLLPARWGARFAGRPSSGRLASVASGGT